MYLCLEGIDGCGKDTQLKLLVNRLIAEGQPVVSSYEPDDSTAIGKLLRQLLASGRHPEAILPLFLADRAASEPARARALADGFHIVQARSFLSTIVYQGLKHPDGLLMLMHREMLHVWPDVIVVLDVTPKQAAERRRGRGKAEEVYELGDWQERVHARYAMTIKFKSMLNVPIVRVDGSGNAEEVHQRVWDVAKGYL